MNPKRIIASGWLTSLLLSCFGQARADGVPCLIFTGNADTEQCIDLAQQNRITFGDSGMTVTSSDNQSIDQTYLLYSLYNRIEIGNAAPSIIGNIESADSKLLFLADSKSIMIESDSELPYEIEIYDIKGVLIANSTVYAGQQLTVAPLKTGVFVAVATNGVSSKIATKFILN